MVSYVAKIRRRLIHLKNKVKYNFSYLEQRTTKCRKIATTHLLLKSLWIIAPRNVLCAVAQNNSTAKMVADFLHFIFLSASNLNFIILWLRNGLSYFLNRKNPLHSITCELLAIQRCLCINIQQLTKCSEFIVYYLLTARIPHGYSNHYPLK